MDNIKDDINYLGRLKENLEFLTNVTKDLSIE